MLVAVTADPLWETVAFQPEVTCWPAVKDQVSLQPLTASPRLLIRTSATNPPDHCETV